MDLRPLRARRGTCQNRAGSELGQTQERQTAQDAETTKSYTIQLLHEGQKVTKKGDSDLRTAKNRRLPKAKIAKILQRTVNGESRRMVARAEGCSFQAVQRVIDLFQPILEQVGKVSSFRHAKADLIDAMQMQAFQSVVDPAKHADANLRDAVYAADVLYKIGRLERGQSTSNAATVTYVKMPDAEPEPAPPAAMPVESED